MPRKREPASKRAATTAKRKPATRKPRPRRSPELREAAEQNSARVEELGGLYRPLHEAAEGELAKTASGKKLLRETRALREELNELHEKIASGKTPDEEGRRLADRRREEFLDRHQEQLLEAYASHARLQPPVEAIAELLQPEMASETLWVAETSLLRGMALRPKPITRSSCGQNPMARNSRQSARDSMTRRRCRVPFGPACSRTTHGERTTGGHRRSAAP
jgi:hypothetical protein